MNYCWSALMIWHLLIFLVTPFTFADLHYQNRIFQHSITQASKSREVREATTTRIHHHKSNGTYSHLNRDYYQEIIENSSTLPTYNYTMHILLPVPAELGTRAHNPSGLTINLVKPVVHEALIYIFGKEIVKKNSLKLYFEDTKSSDAVGPNIAIQYYKNDLLDCIIGYAFVYSVAVVSRISPFWNKRGIPIITSIGLTSNLDDKSEYTLLTRVSSPYKNVVNASISLFNKMKWSKVAYLFHEPRLVHSNITDPFGECYMFINSLQKKMNMEVENKQTHNYNTIDEDNLSIKDITEYLQRLSLHANGKFYFDSKKF
uniref:ANF_receptor domain-containing protein n=1 Tax=Rhabditophanes sp. KR3021 TaxID=114890 RepID=A0AC35U3F6_9BILA